MFRNSLTFGTKDIISPIRVIRIIGKMNIKDHISVVLLRNI